MFLIQTKNQKYFIRYKLNENYTQTTTGTTKKSISKVRLRIFEYGGLELLKVCIRLNIETFKVSELEEIKSKYLSKSLLPVPNNNDVTESKDKYKPLTLKELQTKLKDLTNNNYVDYTFPHLIKYFSKDGINGENIISDSITEEDLYNEDDKIPCYTKYRLNCNRKYFKDRKISPVTFNTELRHFKIFFKKAFKKGFIKSNPFIEIPYTEIPKNPYTIFDKNERSKLIECIDDVLIRNITVYGLLSGCRRKEIINLEWSDIDFQNKVIIIRNKTDFLTKNRDYRVFPMNPSMEKLLLSIDRVEGCSYVFNKNGKKLKGDWVTRNFKKFLRAYGFKDEKHLHHLRHTLINSLVADSNNYNIVKIQKFIGHKSISTTLGYTNLSVEDYRDMSNNISTVVL